MESMMHVPTSDEQLHGQSVLAPSIVGTRRHKAFALAAGHVQPRMARGYGQDDLTTMFSSLVGNMHIIKKVVFPTQ